MSNDFPFSRMWSGIHLVTRLPTDQNLFPFYYIFLNFQCISLPTPNSPQNANYQLYWPNLHLHICIYWPNLYLHICIYYIIYINSCLTLAYLHILTKPVLAYLHILYNIYKFMPNPRPHIPPTERQLSARAALQVSAQEDTVQWRSHDPSGQANGHRWWGVQTCTCTFAYLHIYIY